jgi:hypothetical protein
VAILATPESEFGHGHPPSASEEQWPPAVARVGRGLRLNLGDAAGSPQGAEDSPRDCPRRSQRVSDGATLLTHEARATVFGAQKQAGLVYTLLAAVNPKSKFQNG